MTYKDVDWKAYRLELEVAIDNEQMWMLSSLTEEDFQAHSREVARLKGEMDLIEEGREEVVFGMYDESMWIEFMELVNS